jgi:hypothetical protein
MPRVKERSKSFEKTQGDHGAKGTLFLGTLHGEGAVDDIGVSLGAWGSGFTVIDDRANAGKAKQWKTS